MSQLLGKIRALTWDIDGVKYAYDQFPGLFEMMDQSCARVACRMLPGLDHETSVELSRRSYNEYGDCIGAYAEWARARGIEVDSFKRDLFRDYHAETWARMREVYPEQLRPDAATVRAFRNSRNILQHGAATHSSIEAFTRPLLEHKRVLRFFNESAMIGMDEVNFTRKSQDIAAVLLSAQRMGADLKETGFPEDTADNLKCAKETDSGLTTIYVHHGSPLESLPSYIDAQVRDARELVVTITENHRPRVWVPGQRLE
jgi:phosphoglycolate phosphatase-like HAD superfamily hydrolase